MFKSSAYDWQKAKGIHRFDVRRWTVPVELTLGHTWKDLDHRIDSNLTVHLREPNHLQAVRVEFAVEELVQRIHLEYNVG